MTPDHRCPRCADPVQPQDRFCEECGARVADHPRDRVEVDVGVAAGVSDRGRHRYRNEDALVLRHLPASRDGVAAAVAIACDGVSSTVRSDQASEAAALAAAETMVAALGADDDPEAATRAAVRAANQAVIRLAGDDPAVQNPATRHPGARNVPACTFVSAVVAGGKVTVGWVGDSRAYWIPQAPIDSTPPVRLTEDDSWPAPAPAETPPVTDATVDRQAHAITAWLGRHADQVVPHIVTVEPECPGLVVVCTDGLWRYLPGAEALAAALPAQALDAPLDAARELVEVALRGGGRDNITVALLPCQTQPGGIS